MQDCTTCTWIVEIPKELLMPVTGPWDEDSVILLMQAHQTQSHVPAALRIYETFRERLKQEINLPSRKDLAAFYEPLRRG